MVEGVLTSAYRGIGDVGELVDVEMTLFDLHLLRVFLVEIIAVRVLSPCIR